MQPSGLRTISLALAPSNPTGFGFEAGQYLLVKHPNGTMVPLSIASAPSRLPNLELLYRSDQASEAALAFDELLSKSTSLEVDGPFGDATLAQIQPTQGLRVVASGTGIAQALSLVEALGDMPRPWQTQVLWATQIQTPSSDRLLQNQPWLKVMRCQSAELAAALAASVEQQGEQPSAVKTLIAGPPDFVYQVTDTLLAAGVALDSLAADAFSYAPR